MKSKHYFFNVVLFMGLMPVHAQSIQNTAYEEKRFTKNGETLLYRIIYPENFSPENKYPVVLFLHGAGERGSDNEKQLTHGSSLFSNKDTKKRFPSIVIFPQCPQNDYWSNVKINRSKKGYKKFMFKKKGKPTTSMKLVMALMDQISKAPYVEKNKIYVGGLSMGGMGTFDILKRRPNMFAAAVPICGGGNPKETKRYAKNISVWIFHGAKDDIVHPYFSLKMATALQEKGADVRLTYIENANHNSWKYAFAEQELLPWLFSKNKKSNQ